MKRMIKFLLVMAILASTGLCFNLGSYAKQSSSEFHNGYAELDVLVWTADEIPANVSFYVSEKPVGVDVNIFPESVSIDSSTGSELVSSGNVYANASLVRIIASQQAGCGNGTLRIVARSYSSGEGIGTSQERLFRFSLIGNPCNETKEIIDVQPTSTTAAIANNSVNTPAIGINSNPFYFFIFALSIIILLLCAAKVLKEGF